MTFSRRIPSPIRVADRPWNDARRDIEEAFNDAVTAQDGGLPPGDYQAIPEAVVVGGTGSIGDPANGWSPGNHVHPQETQAPVAIASVNSAGSTGKASDAGHVHKLATLSGVNGTPLVEDSSAPGGFSFSGVYRGARIVLLTGSNGVAVPILQIPIADGDIAAGVLEYETFASDGATPQARRANASFCAVNRGGTITSSITTFGDAAALPSGTLTGLWSIVAGVNLVTLKFTATSSLTPTYQEIQYYFRDLGNPGVVITFY